jgi:hypothetical protein
MSGKNSTTTRKMRTPAGRGEAYDAAKYPPTSRASLTNAEQEKRKVVRFPQGQFILGNRETGLTGLPG